MIRLCIVLLLCNVYTAGGEEIPAHDGRFALPRDVRTHQPPRTYSNRQEWETRREELREQILNAAGLSPLPERTPLDVQHIRTVEREDITVETIVFQPLPGYRVGANIYRPAQSRRRAAVLIAHGHWKNGRIEDLPVYSIPALGVNLARQGYVAMSYDMVGYNDARRLAHVNPGWREQLWGLSPLGVQLWTSMRALDFLASLPDVDASRLAMTGASGGGTQTFMLAAVDARVKVSAPVNMVSAQMQGGDPCEEAPGLRLETSNVEFAAMMAPRPMLLVSSTRDWTRNTPVEEYPAIQSIYGLYGQWQLVENAHIDAEHNYNRQSRAAVYRFLAKHLRHSRQTKDFAEKPYRPFEPGELLAYPEGKDAAEGIEWKELVEWWRTAALARTERITDPQALRAGLRTALAVETTGSVLVGRLENEVLLSRRGHQERIRGRFRPGAGKPVLLVHPDGADAALASAEGVRLLASGRPLLSVDVFQTGPGAKPVAIDKYFYSYNRSPPANRVQDILTALAFLHSEAPGRIELIGLDKAGVWCLFAAAVADNPPELTSRVSGFNGADEDFHNQFFVPGIQRAGGLAAALRLVPVRVESRIRSGWAWRLTNLVR